MVFYPFDDDYVRRLREGDRETWDHFYWHFRDLLLPKLRRKTHSAQLADLEDLFHIVFARVHQKIVNGGEPRDGTRLGPYVNAFADHVAQEWLRKPQAVTNTLDEGGFDVVDTYDADLELIRKQDQQLVKKILSELSKRDAEILTAIYLDEEDRETVCRRYGITPAHLRLLLHRARKRFEEHMPRPPKKT